ncbi:MAG: AMP-dependent synthetase [Aquificota bacterium]|nr:MAG: AMP-dependent synthetase [Aquificota bacterium]
MERLIEEHHLPSKELWPHFVFPDEMVLPPHANLAYSLLDRHVRGGMGDQVAAYFFDKKVTYRELYFGSLRIAHALAELGIKKGTRVAFMLLNSPEALMVNLAIMRLGAIPVPASPFWSPDNMVFILNNVEARCLVVSHSFYGNVRRVKNELHTLEHLILVRAPSHVVEEECCLSLEEILDRGSDDYFLEDVELDDVGVILHTSGTTGRPKGCVHFVRGILTECYLVNKYVWRLTTGDVIGGSAPVTFAAGYGTFCLVPLWAGASVSLVPRFVPEEVLDAIARHRITVLTGLTNTYQKIMESPEFDAYDLSSLRLCTTGGSSLEVRVYQEWLERTGHPLMEGLGATELLHLVTSNAVNMRVKPGSIGIPIPGFEIKVVNEKGEECRPGEMGRMLVKGPTGALYWRPHAADGRLLRAQRRTIIDGYTFLGDIIIKNKNGYLYYISREEDLLFKEGHKIGPMDIEKVLKDHPLVEDAGAIETEEGGREKILAFVSIRPRISPSEDLKSSLMDFCRQKLVSYQMPDEIHFVDFIPRTPAGKPLRWMLRKWELKKGEKN